MQILQNPYHAQGDQVISRLIAKEAVNAPCGGTYKSNIAGRPAIRRKEVSMGDSAEKTAKPKFIDGLKAEFKKISWPDRQSTFKQSVAVVAISVVLGFIIAVLDYIILYGVDVLTRI